MQTDVHESAGVSEALYQLRFKPVTSTMYERICLYRELHSYLAFASFEDREILKAVLRIENQRHLNRIHVSQPLKLAYSCKFLAEKISVPVESHDLILGRTRELVPDAIKLHEIDNGITKALSNLSWIQDGGHETFDWENIVEKGLEGLKNDVITKIKELNEGQISWEIPKYRVMMKNSPESREKILDFLESQVLIYEAMQHYIQRYQAEALANGLNHQADVCLGIIKDPPTSFEAALQLIAFINHFYCTLVARNATLTLGRLDHLLNSYYQKDLHKNTLTRDQALRLIEDLYCKLNLILGRGEHQMGDGDRESATGWHRNPAYDTPIYIIIGGENPQMNPPINALSMLFIEALHPRFENPVVVVRYTTDMAKKYVSFWTLLMDKVRQSASIMIYNDNCVIPALESVGIPHNDALNYTMHGCNWTDLQGSQKLQHVIELIFPALLLDALKIMQSQPQSPNSGLDIEEFYEIFTDLIRFRFWHVMNGIQQHQSVVFQRPPELLRVDDCFISGPLRYLHSASQAGVDYPAVAIRLGSYATAVDSIIALDYLINIEKKYSLGDILTALENNFKGAEVLRQLCLNSPKFGQDNDFADKYAQDFLERVVSKLKSVYLEINNCLFVPFFNLLTDTNYIAWGKQLGATPNGRLAGEPLSENSAPSKGSAINGITALLNSMVKLPLNMMTSGPLNLKFSPKITQGDHGLQIFGSILDTYFEKGGLQTQISITNSEILRKALVNPESHRDLMVRITGYSAVFVDMNPSGQQEILRRAEFSEI